MGAGSNVQYTARGNDGCGPSSGVLHDAPGLVGRSHQWGVRPQRVVHQLTDGVLPSVRPADQRLEDDDQPPSSVHDAPTLADMEP